MGRALSGQAMESYLALGGNELVNAARVKCYLDGGLAPSGYDFRLGGCDGLVDLLPCVTSDPVDPTVGYQMPDLDPAPWYDPTVPESKNFAGLYVTSVTMSSPYSRPVAQNIGDGQTLGRLSRQGRTIVVHGFLVGKTCCATDYGLRWLTSAIGDQPCVGGGCSGSDLDFLSCCPSVAGEDDCLVVCDAEGNQEVYARTSSSTEYQRGTDFFRRMHGAGVVSGPDVISCRGRSCGNCGSTGSLLEVEFTLATKSPYINHIAREVVSDLPGPVCTAVTDDGETCDIEWSTDCPAGECNIRWVTTVDGACVDPECPELDVSCVEDPLHPSPALPPTRGTTSRVSTGCLPLTSERFCMSTAPERIWGDSTLNIEVHAGIAALRNVTIRVWQNPLGLDCGVEQNFVDCAACTTLLVAYIPPNGTLILSGELREVTIECAGTSTPAAPNIASLGAGTFGWPDLTCAAACVCIDYDLHNPGDGAFVSVDLVDRDL